MNIGRGVVRNGSKLALMLFCTVGLLGGCATAPANRDPAEGINRAVFAFNEGLDTVLIRPAAVGYDTVMPAVVRTGVTNFFANLGDIFIGVNDLLQGKGTDAATDAGRFIINSTVGILGIFDVATPAGLEKHEEDFGQTFGRWGANPGAYVVLPVFGPRNVRDSFGLLVDVLVDPVGHVSKVPTRNTLAGVRLISDRSALLAADKVIEEAALDKYSYMRDAYLQRRRNLVFDGSPPREVEAE